MSFWHGYSYKDISPVSLVCTCPRHEQVRLMRKWGLIKHTCSWRDKLIILFSYSVISIQNRICVTLHKIPKFRLISWCGIFFGIAEFRQRFRQIARNSVQTVRFHKIFTPGNLVKIWYFTQCCLPFSVNTSPWSVFTV